MKLNLLKPLKRIFTALTGEETEEKNLVTVVDKIADAVEEGGSGGGSAKKFIVSLGELPLTSGTGTMDKTVAEIKEAYESGKEIWFNVANGDVFYLLLCEGVNNIDYDYPSFVTNSMLYKKLYVFSTKRTNDGADKTCYTQIFPLEEPI